MKLDTDELQTCSRCRKFIGAGDPKYVMGYQTKEGQKLLIYHEACFWLRTKPLPKSPLKVVGKDGNVLEPEVVKPQEEATLRERGGYLKRLPRNGKS